MPRGHSALLLASLFAWGALGAPSTTGCTDSTTGPDSFCERITLAMGGFLIATRCGEATTGGNSNVVRDEQGRVIAFDFDVQCVDGSDRVMGSISGVVYDAQNRITAYQATINGESCTYP